MFEGDVAGCSDEVGVGVSDEDTVEDGDDVGVGVGVRDGVGVDVEEANTVSDTTTDKQGIGPFAGLN